MITDVRRTCISYMKGNTCVPLCLIHDINDSGLQSHVYRLQNRERMKIVLKLNKAYIAGILTGGSGVLRD